MRYTNIMSLGLFFVLLIGIFSINPHSAAASQLVKGESNSAVYYVYNGKRYAFPNEKVYFTWYSDFSQISTITDVELASIPLAGNVTYRPGIKMVKITTDPKVYAVASNGILRWVTNENFAKAYHGENWNKEIHDISDAFFVNYQVGVPITKNSDYNPVGEKNMSSSFIPPAAIEVPATPPLPPPPQPTSPLPTNTCGNGIIDPSEECDGGDHCSFTCKLSTKYQPISFTFTGGSSDHTVTIGSKIAIGDGINIRIDNILDYGANPNGSVVSYSIWGKDTSNSCKLIRASGQFWTKIPENSYREFSDSFLELLNVSGTQALIRQTYGNIARQHCDMIVTGWKQPLACSLFPSDNHNSIDNGSFRVFYYGPESQLGAEYYADAFHNCHQSFLKKIPALADVRPIGRNFRQLYSSISSVNAYSADYERVFLPLDNMTLSKQTIAQKFSWIKDGVCPMQENAIAHELAHMLFSRTFLQGTYDSGTKNEWTDSNAYMKPGSVTPEEGFAQYMTTFISKDTPDAAAKSNTEYWSAFCGKDRVLNPHSGSSYDFSKATTAQMMYTNIFQGNGYAPNSYQAGYCFYKRINDDCGDASLVDLLTKAIQYDGSTASHSTMFKYLRDSCGIDKIKNIMNDFGFSHDLLSMSQKWPNIDFPNGLDQLGCK